jgi:hypothetical protein
MAGWSEHSVQAFVEKLRQTNLAKTRPVRLKPEPRPEQPLVNPVTGEIGGPPGPEPTRFGDWSYKGRCTDF